MPSPYDKLTPKQKQSMEVWENEIYLEERRAWILEHEGRKDEPGLVGLALRFMMLRDPYKTFRRRHHG